MSIEKLVQFVLLLFWINNSNLINRWLYHKMCKLYNEISQSVSQSLVVRCGFISVNINIQFVQLISDDLFGLLISKFVPCCFFFYSIFLFHFGILKISNVLVQSRKRFKHKSLIWFVGGVYIFLCTHFIRILNQLSRKCKRYIFYKLAHKSILFCNTRNIGIDWWCMFHLIHEIQPIKMGHKLVNIES